MDGKLVIARYKNKIIHVSEYQETQHREEIYCPFCNPPVLLEYNSMGFFKAWRNKGGHNCKSINVNYFDADWDGKEYIEVINDISGNMDITIDINSIAKPILQKDSSSSSSPQSCNNSADASEFAKYKRKEKVFREVITSVYQMKRLVEKNDLAALNKLNYIFKVDKDESLNFNEVVYKCNEIDTVPHNKKRFCIFDVDKIVQKDEKVYINSFIRDGFQIVGILKYPYQIRKLKDKLQGQFVIAFGRIIRARADRQKVYLELSNDFHIVKLNDDDVAYLFKNSEKRAFVPPLKLEEKPIIQVPSSKANINNSVYAPLKIDTLPKEQEPIKKLETASPVDIKDSIKDEIPDKMPVLKKESFFKKLIKRLF